MTAVTRLAPDAAPPCRSPLVLTGATVVLGLAAHVLGGGGAVLDCAPLLVAAALGVATALAARRVAGLTYRGAPVAVGMLGIGQLGMHLALSASLSAHIAAAPDHASPGHIAVLGLRCGLLAAHAGATAVLVVLLFGAHQSAESALHLISHARHCVHLPAVLASPRADERTTALPPAPDRVLDFAAQQWRSGLARPRRGPPTAFAS
ncbi:MAG TPA: hypothetical protein VH008_24480 [Pseudonocardia sp.]|nr:hypothetical protein [Pseudonocardia sp.]